MDEAHATAGLTSAQNNSGRRAATGLMVVKATNAALGITTVIFFARWMGAEQYGLYIFAITAAQFIAIPLHFGLPTLLIRESAVLVQSERLGLLRGLIRAAYGLIAVGSFLILLVGMSVLMLMGIDDGTGALFENAAIIIMAGLIVPMISLNKLTLGLLNGLRHTVASRVPDGLIRPALVLALGFGALWLGLLDATSMVGFYLLAASIATLVGIAMMQRVLPSAIAASPPEYKIRPWLGSLVPLAVIAAVQMIKSQTDIVMLGLLTDFENVGQYKIAAQLAMLPLILQTVANAVLAPRIAAAHAAARASELQRQVTRAARWVLLGTLGGLVPLALFGETLLLQVFGADFLPAYIPLLVLSAGVAFAAGSGAVTTLLNMCGLERQTARLVTISAVANALLNLLLIPILGIAGAALATATTMIGMQFAALRVCRRNLGYVPHAFGQA